VLVAQVRVGRSSANAGGPRSLAAASAVATGGRAPVKRQVAWPVRGRSRRHGRTAAVIAAVVGQYVSDHEPRPAEMVHGHGAGRRSGCEFVHGHRVSRRRRPDGFAEAVTAGGHCSC